MPPCGPYEPCCLLYWQDHHTCAVPPLSCCPHRSWRTACCVPCFACAGWAVSLSCPALGVKLTGQQPEQVLLSAELHRLALQMPSSLHSSLTVQQVLIQASSRRNGSSGSSSGGGVVPILQVPMTDQQGALLIQSYTRFGSPEQQTQQGPATRSGAAASGRPAAASDAEFEAATSPKPSTLGRIYHESPLSSYISHVQVRALSPAVNWVRRTYVCCSNAHPCTGECLAALSSGCCVCCTARCIAADHSVLSCAVLWCAAGPTWPDFAPGHQ